MKKTALNIALGVLFINIGAVILTGCTSRPGYQPKSWVSVTKPPIRVIYMDYEKDIDANTVHRLTEQVKTVPYRDYMFNENANINIGFNAAAHSSHSDTTIIDVAGGE